jgi:hypothetical protein
MVMAKYSCRFLDSSNRIDDVEIIECDSDSLAQARASSLFSRRDFPSLELWLLDRLVFRDTKTPSS